MLRLSVLYFAMLPACSHLVAHPVGYTSKQNRPKKGLLFCCQNKQCAYRLRTGRPYTLHADLVGARNIAMRTLLTRQDWVRTGHLSVAPDVSDVETKAARLARYAELRWSSDTRPSR